MPYASNADLSPAVKKAHPSRHGQTVFRGAFNAAHGTRKYSEAQAFKIAHAAADHAEHPHTTVTFRHGAKRKQADPPAAKRATATSRSHPTHINAAHAGKFTAKAKRAGKTVAAQRASHFRHAGRT